MSAMLTGKGVRRGQAGYTPLHYACLAGSVECAVLLRKMGANVEVTNRVSVGQRGETHSGAVC